MSEPFRQMLTSSTLNLNLESAEIHAANVAPGCPVAWSVKKRRLHGGRQEGSEIVEIDSGAWVMRVIPTRGMGILDVVMDDVRLGWDSAVHEVVNPAFINLESRGGTAWLDGFNEWLVRCGIEWFGPPCSDTHHIGKGEVPATKLTLHGKIANIPASELEIEVQTRPPFRVTLRGAVYEMMHYGPKYALATEISFIPGKAGFRVEDRINNFGGQTQEFGLLYHVNFGPPILEPGARMVAPVEWVSPRDEPSVKAGIKQFDQYGGPVAGSSETAYLMKLYADRSGVTEAMLRNKVGDRGCSMRYDTGSLPWFTLWKGQHEERDGYVTGLEPGTNFPLSRPAEREAGRVMRLEPGQTWTGAIDYLIHTSKAEVKAAEQRIAKIQGTRKTMRNEKAGV